MKSTTETLQVQPMHLACTPLTQLTTTHETRGTPLPGGGRREGGMYLCMYV